MPFNYASITNLMNDAASFAQDTASLAQKSVKGIRKIVTGNDNGKKSKLYSYVSTSISLASKDSKIADYLSLASSGFAVYYSIKDFSDKCENSKIDDLIYKHLPSLVKDLLGFYADILKICGDKDAAIYLKQIVNFTNMVLIGLEVFKQKDAEKILDDVQLRP